MHDATAEGPRITEVDGHHGARGRFVVDVPATIAHDPVDRVRRLVERQPVLDAVEHEPSVADASRPRCHREASVVVVVDVRRDEEREPVDLEPVDAATAFGVEHEACRTALESEQCQPSRSMTVALAWPPPSHMVWNP